MALRTLAYILKLKQLPQLLVLTTSLFSQCENGPFNKTLILIVAHWGFFCQGMRDRTIQQHSYYTAVHCNQNEHEN